MNFKENSLGILKSPKDTKVVVAMSGGVDSSTVAGMMKKEGYNVVGITLSFTMILKILSIQNSAALVKT